MFIKMWKIRCGGKSVAASNIRSVYFTITFCTVSTPAHFDLRMYIP